MYCAKFLTKIKSFILAIKLIINVPDFFDIEMNFNSTEKSLHCSTICKRKGLKSTHKCPSIEKLMK